MGSIRAFFNRKHELVKAVNGINFDVQPGELVGFLGPNGAGKTTTLKMLSGLLHPSAGLCRVFGHEPFKREYDFLRSITLVMGQKNQLWWDLPAYDGFLLNQEIYCLDPQQTKHRIESLADWLEVTDKLKVQVRKLSLGERMKVELIAALLHGPKVVFLDEPTIGLDVVSQRRIRQFIRDYNRETGATILLTSHYMQDISELCERVIVIGRGQLLFDGALQDAVNRYATHKVVKADYALTRMPEREMLEKCGVLEVYDAPRIRLRVPREEVARVSAALLALEPDDLAIEEVPVDEVIEQLFEGEAV